MYDKWFTDREDALAMLGSNVTSIRKGTGENLAIVGLRRIGKTELLRKFRERHPGDLIFSLDIQKIVSSPEIFATRYMGSILHQFAQLKGRSFMESFDLVELLGLAGDFGRPVAGEIQKLASELGKAKPDIHSLFSYALQFPESIAKLAEQPVVVCLDEFQDLLGLESFRELKNVLGIFRSIVSEQENVKYIVAGSATRLMEKIFKDPSQPFFLQFRIINLEPFSREHCYELSGKIFDTEEQSFEDEILPQIYRLSFGHPFYITAICLQAVILSRRYQKKKIDRDLLNAAFLEETLSDHGRINLLCNYVYNTSLERVVGGNTLRSILLVLAAEEGLTLTEIANKIKRHTGPVSGYLKSLLASDLIVEDKGRFFFHDPILRFWLAKTALGMDVDYTVDLEVIRKLSQELEQKFLQASGQASLYFESHVREICRNFKGQILPGHLFGVRGEVTVPTGPKVEKFEVYDESGEVHGHPASIEVDLYLRDSQCWVGEIKHENRIVTIPDIKLLLRKSSFLEKNQHLKVDRLWFIALRGFKKDAREFASKNQIYLSTGGDMKEIGRLTLGLTN